MLACIPVSSAHSSRPVEAKIQVLTVGYWPTYPAVAFPLPPVLQASQDHFAAFYTEKYQGESFTRHHRYYLHCATCCWTLRSVVASAGY